MLSLLVILINYLTGGLSITTWIILLSSIAVYFMTKRQYPKLSSKYSQQYGIRYIVKFIFAVVFLSIISLVRRIRRRRHPELEIESDDVSKISTEIHAANLSAFYANDKHGNGLSLRFTRRQFGCADILMQLRLADGRVLYHDATVSDETPSGDDVVSADGLRIQVIDAMKRIRILYSGLMRLEGSSSKIQDEHFVEVNLRMWCRSLCDAANRAVDFHPYLLADCVAKEPWTMKLFREITKSQRIRNIFEQHSEIRGRLEIMPVASKDVEQVELSLHGLRHRVAGELDQQGCETYVAHRVRFDNGYVVSLTASCNPNGLTHLVEGFWHQPNGYVYAIKWSDMHLARFPTNSNAPREYNIHFNAGSRHYALSVELVEEDKHPLTLQDDGILFRNVAKFRLNGKTSGFGHVEVWQLNGQHLSSKSLTHGNKYRKPRLVHQKANDQSLCVSLAEDSSTNSALTGGKAAKLAVLMTSPCADRDFKIPSGFAVTVEAYSRQLCKHPALRQGVENVLKCVRNIAETKDESTTKQNQQKLEVACNELVKLFTETPLADEVKKSIEEYLKAMFDAKDDVLFAVRSSAVGEDSSEASGAGQMETFLGVSGKEEVFAAVKKCWGSHFAYRAVEYRRQMCAQMDSPMAVLIQQLVSADVAGVLFTRHPDTGSTARMVINASYGIGESVVSGTVDVDTITVFKLDETGDNLKISYDHIGDKATALKATEHGMVHQETLPHSLGHAKKCCLSDEEVRRLIKVGRDIEGVFGGGRDVEFAICHSTGAKSGIFILQARPITTADIEQEWELLHEFDTPIASEFEVNTTANIQEIMPGANSPLCCSDWHRNACELAERGLRQGGMRPYSRISVPRGIGLFLQHRFINYTVLCGSCLSEPYKAALDMAIFARTLHEQSLEEIIEQNDTAGSAYRFISSLRQRIASFKNPYKQMEEMEKIVESYQVPTSTDPAELWRQLSQALKFDAQVTATHIEVSNQSTMGNVMMMSVLESDATKWNNSHFSDIAILLSTCTDVFSADVPTLLQDIAMSLAVPEERRQTFLTMERTEAAKWLASEHQSGKSGALFKSFLKKHGHRCVREVDIREKSWHMEPEKVVDALRTMLKSNTLTAVNSKKQPLTIDGAIDSLRNPVSSEQRSQLTKILPKVRTAVGRREWAKSLGVKKTDLSRQGLNKLARLLTNQGVIPDCDLLYFLTVKDIDKLTHQHSPKLIARALRRRKLWPKLSDLHFEEIVKGYPRLIESNPVITNANNNDNLVLEGTPVGQGTVTALARIVTSLGDANQIQSGEILVAPCTDIGWSPYFPLIAGLVTELGGLVSHGAVVAREYGLPCVVGCKQATHLIKTGDQVTINGRTGQVLVIGR